MSTFEEPFLRAENSDPIFVTEDLLDSDWDGAGLASEAYGGGLGTDLSSTVLGSGLGTTVGSTVPGFGTSSNDKGCITFWANSSYEDFIRFWVMTVCMYFIRSSYLEQNTRATDYDI